MAEISLLDPVVILKTIEKFTTPQTNMAMSQIFDSTEDSTDSTAEWDVVVGNREIAKPNVPNSEAHIVPQLGIGRKTASFIYLREKKVFKPTTIRWLRNIGSNSRARGNAEKAVLRELNDLDRRFDAFMEWCCWGAMRGNLVLNFPDLKANVNYLFPASHKPTLAIPWSSITLAEFIEQITALKRVIALDARTPATDVFISGPTMDKVVRILAASPLLLSDRMRDQLVSTGVVMGLLGLNWHINDYGYVDDSLTERKYVADGELFMYTKANRAQYLMQGPSADHEAPEGFVGKFVKSWLEPDPSGRQHLEEWHALPIIERPEQHIFVANVG